MGRRHDVRDQPLVEVTDGRSPRLPTGKLESGRNRWHPAPWRGTRVPSGPGQVGAHSSGMCLIPSLMTTRAIFRRPLGSSSKAGVVGPVRRTSCMLSAPKARHPWPRPGGSRPAVPVSSRPTRATRRRDARCSYTCSICPRQRLGHPRLRFRHRPLGSVQLKG